MASLSRKLLACKALPVEMRAGIEFAPWRHAGMADDPGWSDRPALHDTVHQIFKHRHLRCAEGMRATIVQFYADGAGIYVRLAAPLPCPGMPGAAFLSYHLPERAIRSDQVMGRDFGYGVAEPLKRGLRPIHSSIMQHNQGRRQTVPARP